MKDTSSPGGASSILVSLARAGKMGKISIEQRESTRMNMQSRSGDGELFFIFFVLVHVKKDPLAWT